MKTKLIFSFDSEDYVTPEAADAEKWWAGAMTRHGITACVCVVAELARRLHETGRDDVLDAWAAHEVAYHTDFHSRPPTPAQYLDPCGWEDGVALALAREARGVADVEALTGQHPSAFCKPGSSWGPQICPAMAALEIPVFCDGPFSWTDPATPVRYAGQLMLQYHCHFDGYFDSPENRLDRMKADFEARLDRHRGRYLIMYTHPCRLVTSEFWDGVNFRRGDNPPRDAWRPAPLRPAKAVAAMKADFDAFLAWVAARPDVELTTYREMAREWREPPDRHVARETVVELARRCAASFDAVALEGIAYSPAEILGLAVSAAADGRAASAPLRRLLGPAEEPPHAAAHRIDAAAHRIDAGAAEDLFARADRWMVETGRVPGILPAGSTEVGPGTLLRAASRRLAARGPIGFAIEPGPELPAFADTPQVAEMRFQNGWVVFPGDFRGENVIRHARLPAWTAKPAIAA